MKFLVDAHALIWYVDQDQLLSPAAHAAIADPNHELLLSAATVVQAGLPWNHGDLFDRLLVAQALTENIPIISTDAQIDAYGVTRVW